VFFLQKTAFWVKVIILISVGATSCFADLGDDEISPENLSDFELCRLVTFEVTGFGSRNLVWKTRQESDDDAVALGLKEATKRDLSCTIELMDEARELARLEAEEKRKLEWIKQEKAKARAIEERMKKEEQQRLAAEEARRARAIEEARIKAEAEAKVKWPVEKEQITKALDDAEKRAAAAEMELARIADEQQARQKLVQQDTTRPSITILKISSDDRKAEIAGRAEDDTKLAELRIDGQSIVMDPDGHFYWHGYIPIGGRRIVIEAIDIAGLSDQKVIDLERQAGALPTFPTMPDLDPLRGATGRRNPNALVLIFGVEDYKYANSPARYADHDARLFYDYAVTKLGVAEQNILMLLNQKAERLEIKRAIKDWMLRMSEKGKSEIFVFFAGHGLVSADGNQLFLIPYDGDPFLLEDSALNRQELFDDIMLAEPKAVTVFLDTCYSGSSRDGTSLTGSDRALVFRQKKNGIPPEFTVLSAATSEQVSRSFNDPPHGLFSYFVMKGLEEDADQNKDKSITASELHQFIMEKVTRYSQFQQTPELLGRGDRIIARFQ